MILSVSRRTDIPAFYSEWFFNRVKAGFMDIRNPMNPQQIRRIEINPEVIDCIVFWSKNPEPMLIRLQELAEFNYYFQFTLNPYDSAIEPNVPNKIELLETFKRLSNIVGSKRVIWRYDPILIAEGIDIDYHIQQFEFFAKSLYGKTETCVISFLDRYRKIEKKLATISARSLHDDEIFILAKAFSEIAKAYTISIQTCAEKYNLQAFGITKGKCINDSLTESLFQISVSKQKDKYQRPECGCVTSVDIGEYNSCGHGCMYCYANGNQDVVRRKIANHQSNSSFLIDL